MQRLSYAASSHRLAFEKLSYTRAIKSVALSPSRAERSNAPRIASTQRDWEPVFSPDGARLVFVSDRAGSSDLWLADSSGGAQRRVTHQRADLMTQPRWSPDGTRVVFSFGSAGWAAWRWSTWPRRSSGPLPLEGSFTVGGWSAEGDDLYASRTTEAGVELRRFRPDGSSAARFGRDGLEIVDVSPDRPGLICRDLVDRAIVFPPARWWEGGGCGRIGSVARVARSGCGSRRLLPDASLERGLHAGLLRPRNREGDSLDHPGVVRGLPRGIPRPNAVALRLHPGARDRSHADGTGGGALVGAKGGNVRSSIYGVFRFDPQTVGVLSVLPLLACCSGGAPSLARRSGVGR
ncbi:MAG: PD40 domain-containing protein [Candidatus Eisenbacteria bacterium]|nr:PD40 domain-containing protein [Candidatus Eisenbacteria bacterium]